MTESTQKALALARKYIQDDLDSDLPFSTIEGPEAIEAIDSAIATFQPDGERREAIARLATRFWSIHPKEIQDMGLTREQFYVHEMTNLLASGLVQNEAGIRRDEREKCAKALDDIETDADGKCHWTDVALATAAIRSARDGGAET